MQHQKDNNRSVGSCFRTSITARMFMVGFLILTMLIPLIFIQNLIRERALRQEIMIDEVNQKWGNELLFLGPILKIPYKVYTETIKFDEQTKTTIKEKTAHTKYAFFFPEKLNIKTNVDAIKKEYGIYETSVFSSTINCEGAFAIPNFKLKDIADNDVIWEKATIIIKTSNLKGIKNEVFLTMENKDFNFVPKYQTQDKNSSLNHVLMHDLESSYLSEDVIPKEKIVNFSFQLSANGSEQIQFIPIGKETRLQMTSNWGDPSFTGSFLPEEDENKVVNKSGFNANWNIFHINRQFEQQFFDALPDLSEFAFGAKFFVPVDEYQKSERSSKYGYLVISLTFLVFFLIQTISKIHIHPFQYLMIGLALTMFYTLLISISEHQTFLKAYCIAAIAVVALITLYSRSILKNLKFPMLIMASLTALYAFIFVIIQLENYALLVGSIGLFLILAMVMFFSRKIDWQNN